MSARPLPQKYAQGMPKRQSGLAENLKYNLKSIACGYRIKAITPAFQAGDEGSIPSTRSITASADRISTRIVKTVSSIF